VEHFVDFSKSKLIPLRDNHSLTSFDCGNSDLNEFLLNDSKMYLRHLRYTTFLLEFKERIIAYYSLANDLLTIRDIEDFRNEIENDNDAYLEDVYWEIFYNQGIYPAVKIGRLAVDIEFQNKGIGSSIIRSLIYSYQKKSKTGCQFITVDAVNDHKNGKTLKFYEKHKFKYLTSLDITNDSRAMYKPLVCCR
jgi:GNAT superfamily N-acetyltransferase